MTKRNFVMLVSVGVIAFAAGIGLRPATAQQPTPPVRCEVVGWSVNKPIDVTITGTSTPAPQPPPCPVSSYTKTSNKDRIVARGGDEIIFASETVAGAFELVEGPDTSDDNRTCSVATTVILGTPSGPMTYRVGRGNAVCVRDKNNGGFKGTFTYSLRRCP